MGIIIVVSNVQKQNYWSMIAVTNNTIFMEMVCDYAVHFGIEIFILVVKLVLRNHIEV